MTQDDQRANFLLALDRSDKVELSGFELDFVASNLDRFNFSPRQRLVIDKLIAKYDALIDWNPNRNKVAERAAAEEAVMRSGVCTLARAGKPPLRKTEKVKERLKRVNGKFILDWHPIVSRSVIRFGIRMEDHWINYATGELKAPYLCERDEIVYEFYSG